MAHAESAIEMLQPLVKASARRLDIAEQVTLAKWDSKAAVEDVTTSSFSIPYSLIGIALAEHQHTG